MVTLPILNIDCTAHNYMTTRTVNDNLVCYSN